jgi:hypothetical protein
MEYMVAKAAHSCTPYHLRRSSKLSPDKRRQVALPVEPQWDDLDFLGWIHRSGHPGFLIYESDTGPRGLILERSLVRTKGIRRFICDLCCTLHEQGGIANFTRWNRSRTQSRSYMTCADLQCCLRVRGRRHTGCAQMTETLGASAKIGRLKENLGRIVIGFVSVHDQVRPPDELSPPASIKVNLK